MCRKVWCYTNYDIEGGNFAPKKRQHFDFCLRNDASFKVTIKPMCVHFFHEINKKTEFRIPSKNVLER